MKVYSVYYFTTTSVTCLAYTVYSLLKAVYLAYRSILAISFSQWVRKYSPSFWEGLSAQIYLGLTQILFMPMAGIFSIHSKPVLEGQLKS